MKYEIKIGSFNMKNWSANENADSRKDFEKIAQIIRGEGLDVVGLQEILSEGKGVRNFVNRELLNWEVWPSPELGDSGKVALTKDRRGEGYAYLWNERKFKLSEDTKLGKPQVFKPGIVSENDIGKGDCSFAREPHYIRLQPLYGGFFELRLINVHICYQTKQEEKMSESIKRRKKEFEALTQCVYPAISQRRYGQNRPAYTVAMGDYNLNIFNPNIQTKDRNCNLTQLDSYSEGKRNIHIHTVQDQLTTLRRVEEGFANNFDHFTYSPELSGFIKVSFEAVDAVNKYCGGDFSYYYKHVSDHLPIVMTVEI